MSSEAKDRVVALLKQLDGEAVELSQETEALRMERCHASPVALPKFDRAVTLPPQKHAQKLAEAAMHEERARDMNRKAQKFHKEASTWNAQQTQATRSADEAVRAAEERQKNAEHRLKELQAHKQKSILEQKRKLNDEEVAHCSLMAALERQIEETRRAAEAGTLATRQEVKNTHLRGKEEVANTHAEFQARTEDLHRNTDEQVAACEAAATNAEKRKVEASEAAKKAWDDCEAKMRVANADANHQAQLHENHRDELVANTNNQLADIEANLDRDLATSAAREHALRTDQTAEERCQAVQEAVAADIRRRRAACEAFAGRCRDEIGRLTTEAIAAGSKAMEEAEEARRGADQDVEATLADLDQHMLNMHQGKIKELHAKLNAAVLATRDGLQDVINRFEKESQFQTLEAGQALVEADRHVEELRVNTSSIAEQHADSVERTKRKLQTERHDVAMDAQARLHKTQDEMVKYLDVQHKEMLDYLQQHPTHDMPLQLTLRRGSPLPN